MICFILFLLFVICCKKLSVPRSKQIEFLFQDWLALSQGGAQLTLQGKLQFENSGAPLEQDNFAFCKVMIIFYFEYFL